MGTQAELDIGSSLTGRVVHELGYAVAMLGGLLVTTLQDACKLRLVMLVMLK